MAFAIALIVIVLAAVMVVLPAVDVLRNFFFPRHSGMRGGLCIAQSPASNPIESDVVEDGTVLARADGFRHVVT